VIVIGVLTNTVASVFAIVAPTFPLLIVARVGSGVGAGLVATVVLARLSEIAPPEIRGRVMSLYQVANNLGIAVYPLLGGVVGSLWGWRSAYVLVAVLSLASGAVLAPGLGAVQHATTDPAPKATPTAPGPRRTRILVFAAVYFGVVASMINRHGFRNTVLPLYAAADVHLTAVQSATGITLMSLISVAATIPGAALGDRIGRKRIVVAGLTIVAIGDIVFPMLATTYLTFVIAAMLVGTGDFFSSSQTAVLAELADGPRRSLALGAYRFFVDLGALIGPAMLGALFGSRGMTTTMTVAAVILLAAAVVNQLIVPRTIRSGAT
jgi:MFS family permease